MSIGDKDEFLDEVAQGFEEEIPNEAFAQKMYELTSQDISNEDFVDLIDKQLQGRAKEINESRARKEGSFAVVEDNKVYTFITQKYGKQLLLRIVPAEISYRFQSRPAKKSPQMKGFENLSFEIESPHNIDDRVYFHAVLKNNSDIDLQNLQVVLYSPYLAESPHPVEIVPAGGEHRQPLDMALDTEYEITATEDVAVTSRKGEAEIMSRVRYAKNLLDRVKERHKWCDDNFESSEKEVEKIHEELEDVKKRRDRESAQRKGEHEGEIGNAREEIERLNKAKQKALREMRTARTTEKNQHAMLDGYRRRYRRSRKEADEYRQRPRSISRLGWFLGGATATILAAILGYANKDAIQEHFNRPQVVALTPDQKFWKHMNTSYEIEPGRKYPFAPLYKQIATDAGKDLSQEFVREKLISIMAEKDRKAFLGSPRAEQDKWMYGFRIK